MKPETRFTQLPDHFIDSLRILFDNLDSDRTGRISYRQLCARWSELPTRRQLPDSFLDCLGSITPQNGMITFERFLAAVRQSITEQNSYEIASDARLSQSNLDKKRNGPTMGLNGLDRRSNHSNNTAAMNADEIHQINDVRMRIKKNESQRERFQPPDTKRHSTVRFRPQSTVSFASIASSGIGDAPWRNSQFSSSASTTSPNQTMRDSPRFNTQNKHEMILKEEEDIVNRGIDNATKLLAWYNERLCSVQKRSRLVNKGMVSLDTSVHEQKLNYLRAHISELNRRMTSLMESSEHGFPTHSNLQVKTQMPQPSDDRAHYLQRQNRMLCQELVDKDKVIDELKRQRTAVSNGQQLLVRRGQPKWNSTMNVSRPSALVRPALHQTIETYSNDDIPIKVHNTLI